MQYKYFTLCSIIVHVQLQKQINKINTIHVPNIGHPALGLGPVKAQKLHMLQIHRLLSV